MSIWQELRTRFTGFATWALANHTGKFIGTSIGLTFGLLFVLIGFWRAVVLTAFIMVGFLIGKRYDDHKDIGNWLERFFH